MVNPAVNQTLPDRTLPYLTRDQYRCNPTAIDTQTLIRGGQQADQDAELDRLIRQASAWCDNSAQQPLTAQSTTWSTRVVVAAGGIVRLHPPQSPIVQVTGVSYGQDASLMSTLSDLSNVWVENTSVEVPLASGISAGFSGPLQFGTARPGNRVRLLLTYIAGYPVTTLASGCVATDTTITVADPTGLVPGHQIRLAQGGAPTGTGSQQGTLTDARVTVASVAGSVVTLTGAVGKVFAVGAAATTLPEDVEQAAVLVVSALVKQRGNGALVMGGKNATITSDGKADYPGMEELDEAEAILSSYRPVAP